jgi:hypothetical protein
MMKRFMLPFYLRSIRAKVRRAIFAITVLAIFGMPQAGAEEWDAVRGFVVVEPFEVRLEAIVRVAPFRESWNLPVTLTTGAERGVVLDRAKAELVAGVKVSTGAKQIEFDETRIRFIRPDPEKGYVADERDSIPLNEALVGVVLSSGLQGITNLEVSWVWYGPGQTSAVVEFSSAGAPSARRVTPESPRASWETKEPIILPELVALPKPQTVTISMWKWVLGFGVFLVGCGGILVMRQRLEATRGVGWLAALGLVLIGIGWVKDPAQQLRLSTTEAEEVTYALLRNIYHAFNYRDDSSIYDTLAASLSGPVLERVYLEINDSLDLEKEGGARVRVTDVALRHCEALPRVSQDGIWQSIEWVAVGQVSHWGHSHLRTNRYLADCLLVAEGGQWKVGELVLRDEERLQSVSRQMAEAPPVIKAMPVEAPGADAPGADAPGAEAPGASIPIHEMPRADIPVEVTPLPVPP